VRIFDECQPWIEKTFKQIDQSGQQLITMARRVGSVSTLYNSGASILSAAECPKPTLSKRRRQQGRDRALGCDVDNR
jgi:DNA-binding IclR family transcriptional regulator